VKRRTKQQPQPPALTLEQLRSRAEEFDAISEGQTWPAADFAQWIEYELTVTPGLDRMRRERAEQAMEGF
jgi:hypothetical protein